MAFGFSNNGNAMLGSSTGGGGLNQGPELEVIQTEALGFKSIAGDAKLRLTSAWSTPPADTASLLSIAPRRGLVAAAGPDGIVISSTDSVRKGFESETKETDEGDVHTFQPLGKLPLPMTVSQLAFTADETYLVISAESGGGLAVYETQTLLDGRNQSAFELATNGEALRALVPNPTSEKAELCAIVTNNGNLHIANLKEKQISGALKTQVSCLSWSSKGKQLVAGLADGTIFQMTPEGDGKGEIPRPPGVDNAHVSSLTWLENHLFLAIHTTTNETPGSSVYHIITRKLPSDFTFQKLNDPVDPFGAEKTAHHSILRLRDFPPNLQDLLIVASTASPDVGLISRSKTPLTPDRPADAITNVFTTTELADDSKRASIPMNDAFENTVPVGVALDLSSKDKVYKPLPADEEIEDSPGPLPGFWVLNHEGLLSSWWLVYEDSIRQGTTYPGIAVLDTSTPAPAPVPASSSSAPAPPTATAATAATPFGGPSKPSPFGSAQSTTPAFGAPSPLGGTQPKANPFSAGGAPSPAFGGASALGSIQSPWGTANTTTSASAPSTGSAFGGGGAFGGNSAGMGSPFGQPSATKSPFGSGGAFGSGTPAASSGPAFGQPSSIGFGTSSSLGQKPSPWASGGGSAANASAPAFGQSSFASVGANANKGVFGSGSPSTPAAAPSGGGFSGFANTGGFGSLGNKNVNEGKGVFGSGKPAGSPFGSGSSPFTTSKDTAFPPPSQGTTNSSGINPFSQPFKLESSFKPDPSAKDDDEKPSGGSDSMFGNNFGSALGDAAKQTTPTKEEPMQSVEETPKAKSPFALQGLASTTPKETPAPSRGLFGYGTASTSTGGLGLFSKPAVRSPSGKVETENKNPVEAPVPPESTSRNEYPLGDSSTSSGTGNATSDGGSKPSPKPESAPLPPDFLGTPKASQTKVAEAAPLPPDFMKPSKPKESTPPISDAPLPPDFITPKTNKAVGSTTPATALPLPPAEVDKPKQTAPATAPDFLKMPKQSLSHATWSSTPVSETPAAEPEAAPLPPDFISKAKTPLFPSIPTMPDSDSNSELEDEDESEGSGVDVAKDLSLSIAAMTPAAGLTPQSSFGGVGSSTYSIPRTEEDRPRHSLFGNAPSLPRPSQTSPRSPSPVRSAVPNRIMRQESVRSVSAPGMASQILAAQKKPSSNVGASIIGTKPSEDSFQSQQRLIRQRRQAEETRPLEDEDDDEIQKMLSSKIEPTLKLDDFIAHSNVVPSAKENIPAQVEAVYRDINSMIDTLGLNARSLASFIIGHDVGFKDGGRRKEDLENPDNWVLSEIDELGEVLNRYLARDLDHGRVHNVEDKLEACNDLAREMSRLRSKQDDLRKIIMVKLDPNQADISRSLPLSAEQAAQQNELRREYANFSKLLAEAEEALTILKTRIASVSSASGKGSSNVPTVEAVLRTINKMTSMVEKRSGDIDVLENQMRKLRFSSVNSREGSPMVTPQRNRSIMFSPERLGTASPGTLRNSFVSSVASYGRSNGTPSPRKKLSGFSKDEKTELMTKRAKRQAVIDKLRANVEKAGVANWKLDDLE
ncbi:Nucleoporin NUP159 [Colletotrichum orbiculare MAFF 240422]|uniref:Nucleoporin NUP159 n=1 Tax=Colletotrichum orbiculare (strain 104-T / ATCC 96160 / CBS 514.97 / LARS 414 / MAFF 240422) TaxID=1213857 RepID=N4W5E4_COLOR|nr:Nucleoporin NUP159 [Colletotrichum orbiculare MAFF 240422]